MSDSGRGRSGGRERDTGYASGTNQSSNQEELKKEKAEKKDTMQEAFAKIMKSMGGDDDERSCNTMTVIKYPWKKGARLGRGGFGTVYKAKDSDGFAFAIKEVEHDEEKADFLREEIDMLIKLSHVNIVKCYGFAEGGGKVHMYLELLTGSLGDKIESTGQNFGIEQARKYTKDIMKGLIYLHENDVIHRDIKCANVLLDINDVAKLADMGLSKSHMKQTGYQNEGCVGTPFWMSPEALYDGKVGKRSDIWSVGCTVYEMVKGDPPFVHLNRTSFYFTLDTSDEENLQHNKLVAEDHALPKTLKRFLMSIFVRLCDRPYADVVAKHPWLTSP